MNQLIKNNNNNLATNWRHHFSDFQIYEDSIIKFPQYRGVKLIAEHSRATISYYFYLFIYQGRFSMWNSTTPYGNALILSDFILV